MTEFKNNVFKGKGLLSRIAHKIMEGILYPKTIYTKSHLKIIVLNMLTVYFVVIKISQLVSQIISSESCLHSIAVIQLTENM